MKTTLNCATPPRAALHPSPSGKRTHTGLRPWLRLWLPILILPAVLLMLTGCGSKRQEPMGDEPLAPTAEVMLTQAPADSAAGTSAPSGPAAAIEPLSRDGMYDAPPEMTIDVDKYYYATIRTEKGDIKAQLFADRAPIAVNNFVYLARQGFYDNTSFHRVLDGFMAQAGDPTATGGGGPGYEFADEFYPGLDFDQSGLLAMANRGPGTNGSQFFITFAPTDWLNGLHTIFGKVIEGEDVLAQLTRREPGDATPGDLIYGIDIEETDASILPTPTQSPPTPTPTQTPPPFAPSAPAESERPLATLTPAERVNHFNTAPEMSIDAGKQYTATVLTTQGALTVTLYAQEAPVAVNNFVLLANLGFYDDTPISLVRPDDSIIFGLPDDNPLNDAGYKIAAEFNPDIPIQVGVLTYIPVAQLPDGSVLSSSSQVLIALVEPPPEFQGQLGFFGQIVGGLDLLPLLTTDDRIESIIISMSE